MAVHFELLGTKLSPQDSSCLKLKMCDEFREDGMKVQGKFVGCHPITLTSNNIGLILEDDFLVCEKSDGTRALLFITKYAGKVSGYFYDRKDEFYELNGKFPFGSTVLLDGEIFFEDKKFWTYAIFDCLVYDGVSQIHKNLYKRLGCAQAFVEVIQRTSEMVETTWKETNGEGSKRTPLSTPPVGFHGINFCAKEMLKSYGFWEVYKKIPELKHGNDGLIFTPVDKPYPVGRRGIILKWKPMSLNTVDFKIIRLIEGSEIYSLVCSGKKGKDVVFDYFFNCFQHTEGELNEKIGEFFYDKESYFPDLDDLMFRRGGWKLHKIRTDKDTPNNITVVCDILESIDDDFGIEELSSFYKKMRENSKAREREKQLRAEQT